ncbi:uncharacterized protein [Anabrus simplex]|uniref:uncharacterized protein n=1 Tax=Anabrus simplex TaxID=316456 RepID=UPI0035A27CDC
MLLVRFLIVCTVASASAQTFGIDEGDIENLNNATSAELELFSEAADYLLELHEFFTEYERLKAQSKAEEILHDAFSPAFKNVAAIVEEAEKTERADILECVRKAEENVDQTLDEVRTLLGKCYSMDVDLEENDSKISNDSDDEHEETLRREVADFLQVAVSLLELVSEDTAAMLKGSDQVRQAISQHAIMLARNFQKTRIKVRNCVDLELEEAYKKADRVAADAAACLLLDHHDEL